MPLSVDPKHKNAIVTIVIGEEYQSIWGVMCRPSLERYAQIHGYDLIVITESMDTSARGAARSPAWQKLLILSQPWSAAYERIIWIDADIMVSPKAPNILDSAPDPKLIGMASNKQMSEPERHAYLERLHNVLIRLDALSLAFELHEQNIFSRYGIVNENWPMLNTGVVVLSPLHHRELFERLYEKEEKGRLYEQPYLVEAMFREGLWQELSPRFNWSVHEAYMIFRERDAGMDLEYLKFFLKSELDKAYFLHFCGSMPMLKLITRMTKESGDFLGICAAPQQVAAE